MGLPVQPNGANMAKYPTKPDVLPEVDSGIINNSSNTQRLAIKKGLDHGSRLGILGRTLSIYSRNTHLQMMHHQVMRLPAHGYVYSTLTAFPRACNRSARLHSSFVSCLASFGPHRRSSASHFPEAPPSRATDCAIQTSWTPTTSREVTTISRLRYNAL